MNSPPEQIPSFLPALWSFDRVARQYEESRYLPETVADAVAQFVLAGIKPDSWILDAGIGTGRLGRALARRHTPGADRLPRVVGVDISPVMMQRLQELIQGGPLPRLALADLTALPFADHTFARILCIHVLQLIPRWRDALWEMWRVLEPGGLWIFGVEEREKTRVREFYLARAEERGLLGQYPGAHSSAITRELERQGVPTSSLLLPQMSWVRAVPVEETLQLLAERSFSLLWQIPESAHREILEETREFARQHFADRAAAETLHTRLLLIVALKDGAER